MNAPIAEIPPPAPRRTPNQAPLSLSIIIGIGLFMGAVDVVLMLVFPARQVPYVSETVENIVMFGTLFLLYFLPLSLVWRGANWARWIMIVLSGLGILSQFTLNETSANLPPVRQLMNWLYVPYYLALLVFLLTPAMRRHFKGTPVS